MFERYFQYLIQEAYGSYQLIKSRPRWRKARQAQRQRARLTLMHIVSFAVLAIMLMVKCATAQEVDPRYRFEQPSDEMDFTLPPISDIPQGSPELPPLPNGESPDLYSFESNANDDEDDEQIDQFFSTTTIIAPAVIDEPVEIVDDPVIDIVEENEEEEEVVRPVTRQRSVTRVKPPHRFKSVRLPEAIYHKHNSRNNKHLPLAYQVEDQQLLLGYAVKNNDVDTARALIKHGADINTPTDRGTPLLILAVQHHSVDTTRLLLRYGTNPNMTDSTGISALHYAAYGGDHETTELLLHYGADKEIVDAQGNTPMAYAQSNPTSNIVIGMLAR